MSSKSIEELAQQGAVPPSDFNQHIERIVEVAKDQVILPEDIEAKIDAVTDRFAIGRDTISSAVYSLLNGHLILQGPPGTGKSSLARAICEVVFNVNIATATAHPEWSVFDVIGRQELRINEQGQEEIIPVNGNVVQSIIDCAGQIVKNEDDPTQAQAVWLIIDELNRCEIDRAFGELFTAIGTDDLIPIALSHQRKGNSLMVVPKRYRIIATLNTIDKRFVNELSQALKRRFSFITLDIPSAPVDKDDPIGSSEELKREYQIVATQSMNGAKNRLNIQLSQIDNDTLYEHISLVIKNLYKLVTIVRYPEDDGIFLPIGTAQLIDTIELYLVRSLSTNSISEVNLTQINLQLLDWATSIKIVPLFDIDTVGYQEIIQFAENLANPFNGLTRRELLRSANAGRSYVQ
ncbi:MAG: hypothetical protein Phog2KO_39230 [Phototrophicaceae bacterium]